MLLPHRFDIYDDLIKHQKIDALTFDNLVLVYHIDCLLLFIGDSSKIEFVTQSCLVDRLQQTRSKKAVYM